ncbi:MAG: extracellular solute-binding protein [Ruminococcaceae bacterium]|nr:extracellular solute-binding protein [Oscillospiraceae bacterium]
MKRYGIRLTALLLALLLTATVCGCAPKIDGPDGGDVQPLDGEVPVDLNGYEFTVLDFDSGRWNREASGTPFYDAWLQVLDEVESLYNCTITATYKAPSEMFNTVQPEVAAGGKCADLIISTEWQFGEYLGANMMLDLNELDVNWDNEWWNQSVRKTTTYNNKSYVGGGSFIFDTAKTWLCYVNKAVWEENGFEDPYELVDSGRWTYDKFREYARTATRDNDGSGKPDSSEDIYGVVASDADLCDAWFQAMGGHFFKADEKTGHVKLACNTPRTYEIVEKMYNMIQKDNVYGFLGYGEVEHVQQFIGGGALFYCYMVGKDGLQDMEDDWFVLPMPKFDEKQEEYLSGVDHNSSVFGVTNTNEDLREVSILLEAIGRHAMILEQIFWPDYRDTYWRDSESERIVSEYVVGHGQHDLALIMANCGAAFQAPRGRLFQTVFKQAGPDYSSYIDTVEDAIEMEIQDFFEYDD